MRNWLSGNQFDNALKLRNGFFVLGVFLKCDPQIKPGVRNLRILLLRLLQFRNSLRSLRRVNQRQTIVDTFPC